MIGIPIYNNSETFDSISSAVLKTKVLPDEVLVQKIKENNIDVDTEHLSVFGVFKAFAKLGWLFIIRDDSRNYFTWCKDIRFNYRDRKILIPYYVYEIYEMPYSKHRKYDIWMKEEEDGTVKVKYNYELRVNEVENREHSIGVETLKLLDPSDGSVYSYCLGSKHYLNQSDFSLKELYDRYLTYAVRYDTNDIDITCGKYVPIRGTYESKLRRVLKLTAYKGEYNTSLDYMDVRQYSSEELNKNNENILFDTSTYEYWNDRYEFEAYLFCIARKHLMPVEKEYRESYGCMLEGRRKFIKYGTKFPLILKQYYFRDVEYRTRTYERFIKQEV